MGGRYYITGVQLGILIGSLEAGTYNALAAARSLLAKIQGEQFLGNAEQLEKLKRSL